MIGKISLSVLILIVFSFFNVSGSFSQDNTSGDLPEGEQSDEISLASGGTIQATWTRQCSIQKLNSKRWF